MKLSGSKKGQIANYIAIITFIFTFALLTMIATIVHLGIIEGFTDAGLYTGQIKITGDQFQAALLFHDFVIILMAVALIIGLAATSFKLNTRPIFFVLSIFMATFLGFVSYFFNFIFIQIVSESAFDTVRVLFPFTMILATNLHWVALTCFVIGSISLYAKPPGSGEGGLGQTAKGGFLR